jgi:hypothetical protein
MANENLIHQIIIDGIVITNYSEYSFIHLKSYEESPVRTNGVIVNLNAYKTYITPTLTFSFKYMPIEIYRTLMQLINGSKNEFEVVCYDIINDVQLRAKMYFEPKELANLFILTKGQSIENQLTTLAVLDESFSLIGTNAEINLIPITFDVNGGTLSGDSPNGEAMYGEYFQMTSGEEFTKSGNLVDNFNTKADGTGIAYKPNFIIQVTHPLNLYVIWKVNTIFNLSFSYNVPNGKQVNNEWEKSKEVTYNQPIGELPNPTLDGYTFSGWYWVIPTNQPNLEETEVLSTANYPYQYNSICYGSWVKVGE